MRRRKAIKKLIKSINKNIKVVFHKGQLECDIINKIVYVGSKNSDIADRLFSDFVKENCSECKYNAFLMGILHEVGHIMTWNEELDKDRDEQYSLMKVAYKLGLYDADTLNKEYFKIPLELNATKWGIEYAMSHRRKMNKLDKKIIK